MQRYVFTLKIAVLFAVLFQSGFVALHKARDNEIAFAVQEQECRARQADCSEHNAQCTAARKHAVQQDTTASERLRRCNCQFRSAPAFGQIIKHIVLFLHTFALLL